MLELTLVNIAEYHADVETSLRSYFSLSNPQFFARFAGYLESEVVAELAERLSETDMRSALVVMARIEAAFRIDYQLRAKKQKQPDPVSTKFRKLYKQQGERVRLDEDIWETWRANVNDPAARALISSLRSVFKFRHWLAHGRYWPVGNKYDFQVIYTLADAVLEGFPLLR
jgi:hypothetical protein